MTARRQVLPILLAAFLLGALVWTPAPIIRAQDGEPRPDAGTTTLLVTVRPGHSELTADGLWRGASGQRLEVLAAEKGPARVAVVRDPVAQLYLDQLSRFFLEQRLDAIPDAVPGEFLKGPRQAWDARRLRDPEAFAADGTSFRKRRWEPRDVHLKAARNDLMGLASLGDAAQIRFISPLAVPVSRTVGTSNVFVISPPLSIDRLLRVRQVGKLGLPTRYADAVLIAGQELSSLPERRAVVLVLGSNAQDVSDYPPERVRAELRRLQVPVFVWALSSTAQLDAWQDGQLMVEEPLEDLGDDDLALFIRLTLELRNRLDRQRVVRLAGQHRLQDIQLADQARGIRIIGRQQP